MKSFLICPVRGIDPATQSTIVARLEADGFKVHWPPRDTDQNDTIGLRICSDNMAAIAAADVVHVIWDGKSQGCLFDLGVAFALGKTVAPIRLPAPSEGKSFQNMVVAWATDGHPALSALFHEEGLHGRD
jgi:nucleoside 2-deoxyribosyltransferase